MKARNRLNLLYVFFLLMGLPFACNQERIFEEYEGIESPHWTISDTVSFHLNPENSEQVISAIGIKYNENYEFHNLYVKYFLIDSLGLILEDSLINIELFDTKSGNPLGNGFGNVFTKYDTLPLRELSDNQHLKVKFLQYMRTDQLQGIEAVGLKIVQK